MNHNLKISLTIAQKYFESFNEIDIKTNLLFSLLFDIFRFLNQQQVRMIQIEFLETNHPKNIY